MKIRIFSSFCSTEIATQNYKNIFGRDPGCFVTDDSYTHVIIVNTAMPDISHIPPANVVGLAYEPLPHLSLTSTFIAYAKKHIGRYLIGDASSLPPPFESHYGYMWHKWVTTPIHPGPRCGVSMMVSANRALEGNKYRHTLAHEIIRANLPIDIWGNGVPILKQIFGDAPQLKSEFPDCIGTLFGKYKYSIAIENMQTDSYVSEKFTDCIMTDTIPVYLGARNIHSMFGEKSCIKLTGDITSDMAIIRTVCEDADKWPDSKFPVSRTREHLLTSPGLCLFRAIEEGSFFKAM